MSRTTRAALTAAVALSAVGFLPPPAAQAAPYAQAAALPIQAAPAAPYTALFIDGGPESWRHFGSIVHDSTTGSVFTASATGNDQVDFRVDHRGEYWAFRMAPPTGSTWTNGTEYDISLEPSTTGAYVDVSYFGQTCDEAPGKLHVRDVVRDGGGALTGFAATFVLSCDQNTEDLHGELRWNSAVPYVAGDTDPISFPFGHHLVGSEPVTKKVTVTSLGTVPTEFGAATLTRNSGSFAVTGNTCSGTSRGYGETCELTVTASATRRGGVDTILRLADNSAAGARAVYSEIVGIDPPAATVSPSELSFADQVVGKVGTPQRVTVTGTASTPVTYSVVRIMGNDPSDFVIAADTCRNVSLARGQSCHVDVAAKPTSLGTRRGTLELLAQDDLISPTTVPLTITSSGADLRGTYTPLRPERILDTRSGVGTSPGLVPAGGVVRLQVAGRGGVPASGVSAVVLNVTVVNTQGNGHVTVYPAGVPRPTASSLNFPRDGLRSNSVTVQLSASGQADLHTNTGTHLIADVTGWYAAQHGVSPTALGGQLHPFEPERLFDSRTVWGEPLPGGAFAQIPMNFRDFNPHIRAFIVNITAVNPNSRGYLTAWDGVGDRPITSTVNYFAGTVTPNFAIVPVGPCHLCPGEYRDVPSISVYSSVETHLVVDLLGVIDDGTLPDGLRFEPRAPQRIVDSRQGQGVPGKLGGGVTRTVTAPASVLPPATRALALNVTGVAPTASTYLKVWPTGTGRPDASTLNLAAGQTAANATVALLGGGSPASQFDLYNNSGSVNVLADVVGTFWVYPGTATGVGAKGLGVGVGVGGLSPARADPGPPALGGGNSPAYRN